MSEEKNQQLDIWGNPKNVKNSYSKELQLLNSQNNQVSMKQRIFGKNDFKFFHHDLDHQNIWSKNVRSIRPVVLPLFAILLISSGFGIQDKYEKKDTPNLELQLYRKIRDYFLPSFYNFCDLIEK